MIWEERPSWPLLLPKNCGLAFALRQYHRMWLDFIGFQVAAGLLGYQVTIKILLSFLEYLQQNHISAGKLQNYLTAMHIVNGLETVSFKDERLPLFLKASRIQRPFKPRILAHLDISLLDHLIMQFEKFQSPVVFKSLYLLMFFSFLRLSNVLPHSIAKFDYTRQLARADVIFGTSGAVLLIKWSKTMQNRRDFVTILLPDLAGSHL